MQAKESSAPGVVVKAVIGLAVLAVAVLIVAVLQWWSVLLLVLVVAALCSSGYCCACAVERFIGKLPGRRRPPDES